MKWTAVVWTGLVLGVWGPVAGAQEPERGWVFVREDLDVFIDPAAGELQLEGTLVARLEHAESSPGPWLALNSRDALLRFDDVSAEGATTLLNTTHEDLGQALVSKVTFATPKKRGDEVLISFACHSVAQGRQFVVGESIALASWVEAWYPILPPQEGTSLGGACKTRGTITFHMPMGWHAVTNGELISSESGDGDTVEVWRSDRALARSFAAGPYTVIHETVGDLDVSLYLLSDDLPEPRDNVTSLSLAMKAMERRWGPYPYPSYAIAEVPESKGSFGASSEQGFIMVKPHFLRVPGGNLPLFAHEAAHAWWGNTVGTRAPGELICSETLAQYGAVIAAEEVWGVEGATELLRFSRPGYVADQCARGYFELLNAGRDKVLAELQSGVDVDHTLSDAKGHWVIHMLRRRVGDELFFATMRALIEEYTDAQMSLDDLRARFQEAAPDAGLERFFSQWFERTGAPVLDHDWQATDEGLAVTVMQLQDGEPFELWLDLGIEMDGGAKRLERVTLNEAEQTFFLPGVKEVADVRLDPEHKLLIWNPEYGPAPVPGLEEVLPVVLDDSLLNSCAGEYVVDSVGLTIDLWSEEGALLLSLGGKTEQLVHTGQRRFRSEDGFVIFDGEEGPAGGLLFVRDHGGVRRASRKE